MKQLKHDERKILPPGAQPPSLEDLRALRRARKETNQRVDALKLRLLHLTEHHMDHAVRLIRRWLVEEG